MAKFYLEIWRLFIWKFGQTAFRKTQPNHTYEHLPLLYSLTGLRSLHPARCPRAGLLPTVSATKFGINDRVGNAINVK